MNIYKIVLTGGPCAGKTSITEQIPEMLRERGYYVVTVPETATYFINNKMFPQGNKNHSLVFQQMVLTAQYTKEQLAMDYCKSMIDNDLELIKDKKGIIILCDRGIMDNRAYLEHNEYNELLKKNNHNELELLNSYDLAINLISTATAKPEAYELDGVRYEPIEEAAQKDQITSSAWLLHKNVKSIMPTDEIEEKVNIVFNSIIDFIENKQKEEKISIEIDKEKTNLSEYNDNNSRKIKITSFYIQKSNNTKYILDKTQYNENLSFTIKDTNTNDVKEISYDEYNKLLSLNLLEEFNNQDILYFTYNGNIYSIIEDNLGTRISTNKDNIDNIPKNIILKKTLIK